MMFKSGGLWKRSVWESVFIERRDQRVRKGEGKRFFSWEGGEAKERYQTEEDKNTPKKEKSGVLGEILFSFQSLT